jgi:choline-sulfatase
MPHTDRRRFLKTIGAGGAALALSRPGQAEPKKDRPNILLIITDQQHAGMMSCAGNPHLKTPAMDCLAASGIRFERAYPANPVCLPARFSFFTGHTPSRVGIGQNSDGRHGVPPEFPRSAMGHLLRQTGYETVYGGKVHLPRGMGLDAIGFRRLTGDRRGKLADACAKFLKQPHEKPCLLVASFINPHDICYMAINDHRRTQGQSPIGNQDSRICEGLIEEPRKDLAGFADDHCPPLPDNHAVPKLEPDAVVERYLEARRFRLYAREKWSDDMWRLHRWAYCRLTEMVDAHIGKVLDALRDTGLEKDTLVIFTSDHGDHDSSHGLEHKSILYEEAARIPLVMSHKRRIPAGAVDDEHLVSNGLDLLPTVCDYAGVTPPKGLLGRTIRPLAEGKKGLSWRDHLVVETKAGRMVRTDRYKYVIYDSGKRREQLTDLAADPGETKNLAADPAHQDALRHHRKLLADWVDRNQDRIAAKYIIRS